MKRDDVPNMVNTQYDLVELEAAKKRGLAELPARARMFSRAVGQMFEEVSGVETLMGYARDVQALADSITDKVVARLRQDDQTNDARYIVEAKRRLQRGAEALTFLAGTVGEAEEKMKDSPAILARSKKRKKPEETETAAGEEGGSAAKADQAALAEGMAEYVGAHKAKLQRMASQVLKGTSALNDLMYWLTTEVQYGETSALRRHADTSPGVKAKFTGLKEDLPQIVRHLHDSGLPEAAGLETVETAKGKKAAAGIE
jgi:hypothetical protein